MGEKKSILDNLPVVEKGFPLGELVPTNGVVGNCPKCGLPIYGPTWLRATDSPQAVQLTYLCECRLRTAFETTIDVK